MAEDYYKTLGLDRNTSQDEIQKAYRDLAKKYHPDLNPDDEAAKEKFQKVQQAYEVLNDPKKRDLYDRYGSSFESMGSDGPGGPGGGTSWTFRGGPGGFEGVDFGDLFGGQHGGAEGGGFADIFRQFAGGGRRTRAKAASRRGADLNHEASIPFTTSVTGGEVRLNVRRGTGETETITIKIPAGIQDGKKIRLRGQGEAPPDGGRPGDILITVRVAAHPYYRRQGKNLVVRVPVTVAEAALGAKIDVPTPQGTISLAVPPGTSSGKRLRVKGYGVGIGSASPGDLLAEIQIVLPNTLDERGKGLVREFDANTPLAPRSELRW